MVASSLGEEVLRPGGDVDDAGSGWVILVESSGSSTVTGTSCPCCESLRVSLCGNSRSSPGGKRFDPGGKLPGDIDF